MRLPGNGLSNETCMTGSHLDSVPHGGNFDGLAGVIAGLVAVASIRGVGIAPARHITVMGIRGEENAWFGVQHIGSQIALGRFAPELLDSSRRIDTGSTLSAHIAEAGFDAGPIKEGLAYLNPLAIRCFLELHIEQGPSLEAASLPIGIVSGIRGNLRCADIQCLGAADHAGAVPRTLRRDAVYASCELVCGMNSLWADLEGQGCDLVMTFGKFGTNPATHSITTIPGEVRFSFEARSLAISALSQIEEALRERASIVANMRNVTFQFGRFTRAAPISMNVQLHDALIEGAKTLGISAISIASGAGHDSADFAGAGIRTGMVFVRNQNGSHNPAESMNMSDFMEGTRLLTWMLAREATADD